MKKFNVGDIIKLKSGGPKMTVLADTTFSDYIIYASFFSNGQLFKKTFPVEAVEKFNPGGTVLDIKALSLILNQEVNVGKRYGIDRFIVGDTVPSTPRAGEEDLLFFYNGTKEFLLFDREKCKYVPLEEKRIGRCEPMLFHEDSPKSGWFRLDGRCINDIDGATQAQKKNLRSVLDSSVLPISLTEPGDPQMFIFAGYAEKQPWQD